MPQSERANVIKELLLWLDAHPRGVLIGELIRHVELEVTDMGASTRTIKGYIMRCRKQGLIYADGLKLKTTKVCKNWLQRKVS